MTRIMPTIEMRAKAVQLRANLVIEMVFIVSKYACERLSLPQRASSRGRWLLASMYNTRVMHEPMKREVHRALLFLTLMYVSFSAMLFTFSDAKNRVGKPITTSVITTAAIPNLKLSLSQ